MPTKGSSRRHEAIDLTPASRHVEDEDDDRDQDLSEAGQAQGEGRTPVRTYEGEDTAVEMHHVTGVREAARAAEDGTEVDVEVTDGDGVSVTGPVRVRPAAEGERGQVWHIAEGAGGLACSQHPDDEACGHREHALEATEALVGARRIRPALEEFDRARREAEAGLADERAASEAARQAAGRPEPDGPLFTEDRTAFQNAYRQARDARRQHGETEGVVDYRMEDGATGGLADPDGGRAFGVELEFDVVGSTVGRRRALELIGRDLHEAGLTGSPRQRGYHAGRSEGYQQWSFESDGSVNGEIVSPIMYDSQESWEQLAEVCEIVRSHGGQATTRCGGHVHVDCGDFDHTPENHSRLLAMFDGYEDVLYRLAQNPSASAHRGRGWCRPNRVPAGDYETVAAVRGDNRGHGLALNFESVAGRESDHVEFRMWDGTLDPGVIQTHIKLSLGMTDAAFRDASSHQGREPIGTHRQANAHLSSGQRLRGQAWQADTQSFRRLVDDVFWRTADKIQATQLFGLTRWQRGTR